MKICGEGSTPRAMYKCRRKGTIEFGSLVLIPDTIRGGYSVNVDVAGVRLTVHAIKRRAWKARVWVDGMSTCESKGISAREAIDYAIQDQIAYFRRRIAALEAMESI